MKRNIATASAAFAAGIAGFFIRTRQLASAYDEAGLHITPDPWGTALIALCAAAAVLIFLMSFMMKNSERIELTQNVLAVGLSCLGAAVLVIYCVLSFLRFTQTRDILTNFLFPVFGIAAAFCTIVFSAGVYKGTRGSRLSAAGAIPVFFGCLWLIVCYRSNAIETTISLFSYELLAIILTVISLCVITHCIVYEKSSPLALAFPALALFMTIVTLADSREGIDTLLFVYAAIEMACGALLAQGGPGKDEEDEE